MRVVVHEYAPGGRFAYETSSDGSLFAGEWDGTQQVGERISAFVEALCDDTSEGVDRLLGTLEWLSEEIKKRKGNLIKEPKKRKGKSISA